MPHQILKFRKLTSKDDPSLTGHKDSLIIEDFRDIFDESLVLKYPESERYNLVATIGFCHPDGIRSTKFVAQDIIPIDIDHIDSSMRGDVFKTVCAALCLPEDQVGCMDTGNGIHIYIKVTRWMDEAFFDNAKEAYSNMCSMLQSILEGNALQGKLDSNIWAKNRTTRIAGSINDKTHLGRGRTHVRCISKGLVEQKDFDLLSFRSLSNIRESTDESVGGVDVASVLECPFIMHCKESVATLPEPEWTAMIGVLAFLKDGDSLCHEYSKGHPSYRPDETDKKAAAALKMTGPRTCANISTLFSGCASCKFQKERPIKTPLHIRSDSFIATEKTGFHRVINGKRVPAIEDMEKYIKKTIHYKVDAASNLVYYYDKEAHHWKEYVNAETNFSSTIKKLFYPEQNMATINEVVKRLLISNVENGSLASEQKTDLSQFVGQVNLKNGVYNFKTGELRAHDPKDNFMYCLDFDYDPNALCPTFDAMCFNMFEEHPEYTNILLEFLGYGLSGIPSRKFEKCLVLLGSGSNGKSTLCKVFESLAGAANCTSHNIGRLRTDAGLELRGKIFNLVREMPVDDFQDPEFFKNLITGEPIFMHKMHVSKFSESTNAKHLLCCNTMPSIKDKKHGFERRLIIMKLTKSFSKTSGSFDRNIEEKLHAERAGIFNKAIEGARRLLRQDDFTKSLSAEKTLSDFKKESDTVAMWFDECCELHTDSSKWPVSTEAYKSYTTWCQDNGHKYPVSNITFLRSLQENISDKITKFSSSINGKSCRKYSNFCLVQQFNSGF